MEIYQGVTRRNSENFLRLHNTIEHTSPLAGPETPEGMSDRRADLGLAISLFFNIMSLDSLEAISEFLFAFARGLSRVFASKITSSAVTILDDLWRCGERSTFSLSRLLFESWDVVCRFFRDESFRFPSASSCFFSVALDMFERTIK